MNFYLFLIIFLTEGSDDYLLSHTVTDTDECFKMSLRQNKEAVFNNEQNNNFLVLFYTTSIFIIMILYI